MNRRMYLAHFALTVLAPLGLALPAAAQTPVKDQVPFKAAFKGNFQGLVVSEVPPLCASLHETGAGQATELGDFKWAANLRIYIGADGNDAFGIGVSGAFTAANGDAIAVTYALIPRDLSVPGEGTYDGAWVVTGGKGRFEGATGSGKAQFHVKYEPGEVSTTWEGTITAPKK